MKNKFDRKLFKEVIDYYNNDFMEEWEILTLPELKVVDTYDDILIHDNKFLYKHDKNVYIECATTCHYMIYVLSGEKCDDSCSDETMMNLIQWKKQLVQQERISEQSLQLVVDI